MSEAVRQFVEIIREAGAFRHWMYCDGCGKDTRHALRRDGDYEIYTCGCGRQRWFKVS